MSFIKILFTSPVAVENETDIITRLMLAGAVDILHLRRYDADENALRTFLDNIPSSLHNRIRLHSHYWLAEEYSLRGIHLSSHTPISNKELFRFPPHYLSRSCHSVDEMTKSIQNAPENVYEYITLSPVFDSISKSGYSRKFDLEQLKNTLPPKCVALGGVTPGHFKALKQTGFIGAAMLGYVWNNNIDTASLANKIMEECYSI